MSNKIQCKFREKQAKDRFPIILKIHITYVYRTTRNNSFKTRGLEKDAYISDIWINHRVQVPGISG